MAILPINNIFREKKFALLIAVDSSSRKALLMPTYIDNLLVTVFQGTLPISLLPPKYRYEGTEVLLPRGKELPMYLSLLHETTATSRVLSSWE